MTTIARGNTGRLSVTFVPVAGTVSLSDVSCSIVSPSNIPDALTVHEAAENRFYADVIVDDSTQLGEWTVRWDSDLPSELITITDVYTVVATPSPERRSRAIVAVTVNRIRRQLDSALRQETNRLGAALNAGEDVVTMDFEIQPSCRAGAILSIGNELMRVVSVLHAAKEVTVMRGWQDSIDADHADASEVLISPRFTLMDIKDAMVAEIDSWAPRLFRVVDYQWSVTDADESVELPYALSEALGVIGVRRQWAEEQDSSAWPTISYRLMRGTPGVWSGAATSGLRIRLLPFNGQARTGSVFATLAMPFDVSSDVLRDEEDLVEDYGLAHSMLEVVELGVKMRIMADAESSRSSRTQQDEPRRAEETPPGAALTLAQTWRNTYTRRMGDETRKLLNKYPVSSW